MHSRVAEEDVFHKLLKSPASITPALNNKNQNVLGLKDSALSIAMDNDSA